ncbi:MAG: hypothetical protein KGH94_04045 [Candidatus Micrarchaeota archaeon]|nr:hypothetical protein [Candidatus Micrarchaeota archaeon]
MKESREDFVERKMKMWKMREEFINSMSDKELKAFIKGYMMGERTIFKRLSKMQGCGCGCGGGCSCGGSCNCDEKECNCGKEE